MSPKSDLKVCVLWLLLFTQVVFVVYYVVTTTASIKGQPTETPHDSENIFLPVSFKQNDNLKKAQNVLVVDSEITISQRDDDSRINDYFVSFNGTYCFSEGTDMAYMNRVRYKSNNRFANCMCKRGWHGKDCGQPEVIWRGFFASHRRIVPRYRSAPRLIIHLFPVWHSDPLLVEAKINELQDVVDLFVITESNISRGGHSKDLHFYNRLQRGYLSKFHNKILYIPYSDKSAHYNNSNNKIWYNLWHKARKLIKHTNNDDLLLILDENEIPNIKALTFLKLYDGWPEIISFRLRLSVYGFFWQHEMKAVEVLGACTIKVMNDIFLGNATKFRNALNIFGLESQPFGNDIRDSRLVVGDLNHYGGWRCDWCFEPHNIVSELQISNLENDTESILKVKSNITKYLETNHVADMIGSGTWFDGSSPFLRKTRSSDSYFAPHFILNNTWQYDHLLTNVYSDIDF